MGIQRGRFITVEGGEGAGKSTHLSTMVDYLRAEGIEVISTREPGGTGVAEAIRELLLARRDESLDALTELLLVFAARAQHVARVIRPALAVGRWVVCDRFTDASYAYQAAGRQMGPHPVTLLAGLVHPDLKPDLTLYLDVPTAQGLARARSRGRPDRFEEETDPFFDRVRQGYLDLAAAEPDRMKTVNAAGDLEYVRNKVLAALDVFLAQYRQGRA